LQALNLIPPTTPLSKLYFYFENVICDINKDRRTKQIQMNLQAAERMKVTRCVIGLTLSSTLISFRFLYWII
jgi:hypothetical protein